MLHGLKNARKYHEGNRVLSVEILNAGRGYSNRSEVSLIGTGTGFLGRLETNASGSITGVQIIDAGKTIPLINPSRYSMKTERMRQFGR